jgi:transmembrane sensor
MEERRLNRKTPQVIEQAAAWVEWTSDGAAGPDKARAFDQWMAAAPEHREAFAELLALWRSDAMAEAAAEAHAADNRRRAPGRPIWLAAAMATAVAAVAAVAIAPLREDEVFETPHGHGRLVRLADGSQAHLNGATRLEVRQGFFFRRATLEAGEAYFDVRHEPRRPFTVDAGEARVRVLGTAFDIDRHARGGVELAVYRGAVGVETSAGASARLTRGQRAAVQAGAIVRVARPAGEAPDWISGWFEASDATLGQLMEEIGRFADRPVATNQAALAERRITGRFHVADPASALTAASLAYGLRVSTSPERILVQTARAPLASQ